MRNARAKKPAIRCIEYLSVPDVLEDAESYENRQRKYIRQYAAANGCQIVGTVRRHGFGPNFVKKQWEHIAKLICCGKADGVIVANMALVAKDLPDAFYMLGLIMEADGVLVSVDDGKLSYKIGGFEDARA